MDDCIAKNRAEQVASSVKKFHGIVLSAVVGFSGCATYVAKPLDPALIAARLQSRSLDDPTVCAQLHRLAKTRTCDLHTLDGLDLLIAAMVFNPSINATEAAIRSAIAQAKAARVRPGPTLTLSTEYANETGTASSWLYGLAADLPLDVGSRRDARISQADASVALATLDRLQMLWTIRMALRTATIDRAEAVAERAIFMTQTDIRNRQIASADRRLAEGEISRTSVDLLKADASSDMTQSLDAMRRLSAADADIAAAIGLPVTQLRNRAIEWPDFATPTRFTDDELEVLTGQAVSRRPAILRAMVGYDIAEANLRASIAEQFPAIRVNAGYTWERGLVKLPAGLGLALPPLDLNRAAIQSAISARDEAGAQLEVVVNQVLTDFDAARTAYQSAWYGVDTIRATSLLSATALAQQSDRELEAGLIDRVDWSSAQIAFARARLDEIVAIARLRSAEGRLEDALQLPLSGPEQGIGLQESNEETNW